MLFGGCKTAQASCYRKTPRQATRPGRLRCSRLYRQKVEFRRGRPHQAHTGAPPLSPQMAGTANPSPVWRRIVDPAHIQPFSGEPHAGARSLRIFDSSAFICPRSSRFAPRRDCGDARMTRRHQATKAAHNQDIALSPPAAWPVLTQVSSYKRRQELCPDWTCASPRHNRVNRSCDPCDRSPELRSAFQASRNRSTGLVRLDRYRFMRQSRCAAASSA